MEEGFVRDISEIDYTDRVLVENPENPEACSRIKRMTNARICVGKAGTGTRTEPYLRYLADHAAALDSVWAEVDEKLIERMKFFRVSTMAETKEEYIRRPDKGRIFSKEMLRRISENCKHDIDVQILVADGLSAYAIEENVEDVYQILVEGFRNLGYRVGTPIFIRHGRVATMDYISECLNAKVTILLVGERPGLITNRSMSCYMAYESSPKKPESQRTVISNIYSQGTVPVEAGAQIVYLTTVLMREKKSGSELRL